MNRIINHLLQFFTFAKRLKTNGRFVLFSGFLLAYIACSKEPESNNAPFLNIIDGQFEIEAVILEGSSNSSGAPSGSGTLSFNFTGDIEGAFSVSGPLTSNQTEKDAVGAILEMFEIVDDDFDRTDIFEGFTLLGFHPTGSGKADIFILGTKTEEPYLLSAIKPDTFYGIGPFANFSGLYLNGVDIGDFWTGDKNLIKASNKAFALTSGTIHVVTRDSTHIIGTFSGTTDANRTTSLSKHFPLR